MRASCWFSIAAAFFASLGAHATGSLTDRIWISDQPWIKAVMRASDPAGLCRDKIVDLVLDLDLYRIHAKKNEHKEAQNQLNQMQKTLHLLDDSKSICFEPVAYAYVGFSIKMLSPSGPATEHSENDTDHSAWITSAPYLSLEPIVEMLFQAKSLTLLTPKQRRALGPSWKSKILAAYDCYSSKIFIDPFLPPLDLGGTFVHEVDHLIRDKLNPWEQVGETTEALLLDEFLAALQGANSQILLNSEVRSSDGLLDTLFKKGQTPFSGSYDRSLFSKSGNFEALAGNLVGDWFAGGSFFNTFLSPTVIQGAAQNKSIYSKFDLILGEISGLYFSDHRAVPFFSELVEKIKIFKPVSLQSIAFQAMDLNTNDSSLDRLRRSLNTTSVACSDFASHAGQKDFEAYLGTRLSREAPIHPGIEGLRPGIEGLRPELIGIRPCLHLGPAF